MLRVLRRGSALMAVVVLAACTGGGGPTGSPAAAASVSATDAPATSAPTIAPTARPDLLVVAVGDSIPYNSPDDCPGCTGFVDIYANAVSAATGKSVGVQNLSQHTGLQVDGLLAQLSSNQLQIDALTDADVIIVGIAHNDVPMNRDDDSCDGVGGETPDWSLFTDACIAAEVERYTPKYESVYEQIAAMRAGTPTILRTINRYNDWNGWPAHELPARGIRATADVIAAWNEMICGAAEAHGFVCADISTAFNGADGREPSGDLLAADYTHPSQAGNDLIAEVLIELGFAPLDT